MSAHQHDELCPVATVYDAMGDRPKVAAGAQPVDVLAVNAAVAAAHDPIIVHNSLTRAGGYSPYCMRCTGLVRMEQVGVLHWRHHCGAEHDEAEARAALARVQGGAA